METSTGRAVDQEALTERAPVIGGFLIVMAGVAVGGASFLGGATPGFEGRLPVYALVGAVLFVGALLRMRYSPQQGSAVLRRATAIGVLGIVLVGLWAEAAVYGLIIVVPGLSLYLAAAVIVAIGLVYWSVRNWWNFDDLTRP